MAQRVVDVLEPVEIDEQHGVIERPVARRPRHRLQLQLELEAVGEAGQRIVMGEIGDPVFGGDAARHLFLDRRIGFLQPGGPLGDARLQPAPRLLQRRVGAEQLQLLAPAGDLLGDARQRDGEIDRLGDIIVGPKLQGLDDVLGFRSSRSP